jgi:hypothetical protein
MHDSAPIRREAIPLVDDRRLHYRRKFGSPGVCHVRLFALPDLRHLVLITESAENHGPSIMSVVDTIATDVVRTHHLDPASTIFIEHFDDRSWRTARRVDRSAGGLRRRDGDEDFDRVRFTILRDEASQPLLTNPQWSPVRKQQIERLLGGTLP